MKSSDSPAARYSEAEPPHIYRPVKDLGQIEYVQDLMSDLVNEGIVAKELKFYRLDTLLLRETRMISHLGSAAVSRYVESIDALGTRARWDEPLEVKVNSLRAYYRQGGSGNRIVMELNHSDQLIKEREWALAITRRMAGEDLPKLNRRLSIATGVLMPLINPAAIQSRLDQARPSKITLLPTKIDY